MNNLDRELAPIADVAWAQIEDQTRRRFRRHVTGRRVVDVVGDDELHLGHQLSIGYLSRDADHIELYLQESSTFLALTSESSVSLRTG